MGYWPGRGFIRFLLLLLLFCLTQYSCSSSFFHSGQSKHSHSRWCGSSNPPGWLWGPVLQGQGASPDQQQPIHSRGPMPIWMITGYLVAQHRCVPFSSLFLLPIWHCSFSLSLPAPTEKHCVPDQTKAAQVYGAEGKQHGGRREVIVSQIFPTHLPGQ